MLEFVGPVQGEPLMKGYGLGVVDIDLGALDASMGARADLRTFGTAVRIYDICWILPPTMESLWRSCQTGAATETRTGR